jgi:hypothetical protein
VAAYQLNPPHPKKNLSVNISWKHSRLDLLRSRRHPPHLLSSQNQTINAEYYLYILVQLKDILKGKRRGKFIKWVLFMHDNAQAHRALATLKNLAYLASNVFITNPILRIWPRRTTTFSLD